MGSVKINGSSRLNVTGRITVAQRSGLVVRAQQSEAAPETTRRSVIGLVAAGLAGGSFVQAVLADAVPIKIGPPPPPSGGLHNSNQAVARAKESAKEIVNVNSMEMMS
ncbi:hypothetical protein HID58_041294 [Brassica napus]|uniref:Uncharacterized protein n=1 Tax=Brassica napus TaxID=3708 RepID=A0ABQ8BC19_BRANA|nr:hypothetical protein HID58_041294 [Brassica napus]